MSLELNDGREEHNVVPDVNKVVYLPVDSLYPFSEQPFGMRSDAAMENTIASVRERGVIVPAIVRPRIDGGFEIIAGHRRKHACEVVGIDKMPCIVRSMTDDEAVIVMVDTNLQREEVLPSERAHAYKMKLNAIKRQGARRDLISGADVDKRSASDRVGEDVGESGANVKRFIRLTELNRYLLNLVDQKRIGFTPAVELSYLKPHEQDLLVETIESEGTTPSLGQAQRMKKLSQAGNLNEDNMLDIMMEPKKPDLEYSIPISKFRKYFKQSVSDEQIEAAVIKIVDSYARKKQQAHER